MILAAQLVLVTLAAYAFARFEFPGRDVAFALVLVQLMVMPDVLLVENYRTMTALSSRTRFSRSACQLLRARSEYSCCARRSRLCQRARRGGARRSRSPLATLWKVYVPLGRPTYLAFALVSVSYHWNNFLWPLIISNSVESRPVTVGLQVFSAADQGIDWSIINAATLLSAGPLLIAFLLFQRQFVQSFMRAGIK